MQFPPTFLERPFGGRPKDMGPTVGVVRGLCLMSILLASLAPNAVLVAAKTGTKKPPPYLPPPLITPPPNNDDFPPPPKGGPPPSPWRPYPNPAPIPSPAGPGPWGQFPWGPYPWPTPTPRKIIVGGAMKWNFGIDYASWACNNIPFYQFDTLVFQYAPDPQGRSHSVYLLQDLDHYNTCNFTGAIMLANTTQGGGDGFGFMPIFPRPHFFACGEHDGIHCSIGRMKFIVVPSTVF